MIRRYLLIKTIQEVRQVYAESEQEAMRNYYADKSTFVDSKIVKPVEVIEKED
jgi:hypothetical protein